MACAAGIFMLMGWLARALPAGVFVVIPAAVLLLGIGWGMDRHHQYLKRKSGARN